MICVNVLGSIFSCNFCVKVVWFKAGALQLLQNQLEYFPTERIVIHIFCLDRVVKTFTVEKNGCQESAGNNGLELTCTSGNQFPPCVWIKSAQYTCITPEGQQGKVFFLPLLLKDVKSVFRISLTFFRGNVTRTRLVNSPIKKIW